uniref:ATP synthase F0 subunit 8 n=1 Tax=Gonimbrasia cytherea TaxID=2059211 RepID=UPI001F1421AC|nr:ATP synthase F0 subunit 8 [Gonimbrasia cytherea]ULO26169.1 ATP synthase F0 subunit 8 [Gonimbrasia cytherea]
MPQMMPINWMISFIFFIIIFLIFNIMNYYIFKMNIFTNKKLINNNFKNKFLWKW